MSLLVHKRRLVKQKNCEKKFSSVHDLTMTLLKDIVQGLKLRKILHKHTKASFPALLMCTAKKNFSNKCTFQCKLASVNATLMYFINFQPFFETVL